MDGFWEELINHYSAYDVKDVLLSFRLYIVNVFELFEGTVFITFFKLFL